MRTVRRKPSARIPASQDRRFAIAIARIVAERTKRRGTNDVVRRVGTSSLSIGSRVPADVSGTPATVVGMRFSIPEDRVLSFDATGTPNSYELFEGVRHVEGSGTPVGAGQYGRRQFDLATGIVWFGGGRSEEQG